MSSRSQRKMDLLSDDIIKNEEEEVVPGTVDNLRSQRIKRGECPTCQRKTHKVSRFKNKREPLTVDGEVVNGICLLCNPLTKTPAADTADTVPAKAAPVKVPDTFVCDDDLTVASEITLDTCIVQQISKRSNRYNKSFESVSEGKAMTNFSKCDDEVPKDIIGSQRGKRDRGRGQPPMPRLVDDEDDDEEEDKKWIATQRRQRFHPMSREMYLFNSERSLGIESTGTGVESTDGSERSSDCFVPPKLHPLSRELHRYTSERSLSVSMNESQSSGRKKMSKQPSDKSLSLEEVTQNESSNTNSDKTDNRGTPVIKREPSATSLSAVSSDSGYSSDGRRIKRLLKGSTSLLKEEEKVEAQADAVDASHLRSYQRSASDSFTPSSVNPKESRRPNRFSLRQSDQNRFSLTMKDLLRASAPKDPTVDFETEMRNSRNWNSVDILRGAAAEVNGEKFNLNDFAKEMKEELLARSDEKGPEVQSSSNNAATKETTTSADELSPSLSSPPSIGNEAGTADQPDVSGLSAEDINHN